MENSVTHPDFPILSLYFTIISWYSYLITTFDLHALDNTVFLPIAHLAAIGSGITAMVLGAISLKEKYNKWKSKK